MKEQFRAVLSAGIPATDAIVQLDRWIAGALRSRLEPFKKVARTMRDKRPLIVNALKHNITNGRVEGMNTKIRLLIRRAYGFHSATAALALVMLACGPINLALPHEQPAVPTAA
jgi:transposase